VRQVGEHLLLLLPHLLVNPQLGKVLHVRRHLGQRLQQGHITVVAQQILLPMDQIPIKTPNPKCRLFLKIDQKKVLGVGCYLSEAHDPPPPVTHCMNTFPCTYSHREGGGGVR
jgi:hypothetical protein